jgi:hypothetical protein
MKKIVSIIIILFSLFLIFKIAKIYSRYKYERENYAALKQKQRNLNSEIMSIKRVKIPKTVYGYHRLTTYLFTFLSYINYLNSNGFKIKVDLIKVPVSIITSPNMTGGGKPGFITAPRPLHVFSKTKGYDKKEIIPANFGQIKNLSYYIGGSNTFYGLKKINIKLKITKYYSIKEFLLILNNIRNLFPSKINFIKISKKRINITFNLYGA